MRRRRGFTLVEMLVSTVLIIFIMVILTQSFKTGMDAFRQLKTIGDMQERLRMATGILRKDLAADHFEGKKRLSDSTFWLNGPPREGFFRLFQGGPSVSEGKDGDGNDSWVATNHYLHFTVKRRGNKREEFAVATIDGNIDPTSPLPSVGLGGDSRFQVPGTYSSQWYEVVYFLKATGEVTPNGVPRFNLYRRQRLLVTTPVINYVDKTGASTPVNINFDATPPNNPGPAPAWATPVAANKIGAYSEISCSVNPDPGFASQLYFNSPADVTIPDRRFGGMNPKGVFPILTDAAGNPTSADLLLADVLSFDVRVAAGGNDFLDLSQIYVTFPNSLFPATGIPSVFDTWSSIKDDVFDYSQWSPPGAMPAAVTIPGQLQIQALQISIRVWDMKTRTARQITIVQDM